MICHTNIPLILTTTPLAQPCSAPSSTLASLLSMPWPFSAKIDSSHAVRLCLPATTRLDTNLSAVGWGSSAAPQGASFNQYDQNGFSAQQEVGIKTKLIELISAVRTLMRSMCLYPPSVLVPNVFSSTAHSCKYRRYWLRTRSWWLNAAFSSDFMYFYRTEHTSIPR